MAATIVDEGDQTATLDTEHQLDLVTSADGTYQLQVDLNNLANGDIVILRVKTTVRSTSGTRRTIFEGAYSGEQAVPIAVSPPVVSAVDFEATLEQTDGTGRVFPWNVTKL